VVKYFLSAVVAISLTDIADAQTTETLVCQYIASGGLVWDSGAWRATEFLLDSPFALTVSNGTLAPDSVARGLVVSSSSKYECVVDPSAFFETCTGPVGPSLSFNHITNQGVVSFSFIFGQMSQRMESLVVSPFVCQRM
jgi:hypothetical protein